MYEIIALLIGTLADTLILALNELGVDLTTINISIGFYETWFTVTADTLLYVVFGVIVWTMVIKITWNIFKSIFRKVSGR